MSDLWAHQTTYSANYLKWFFTKKIFWEMFPWTEIKIQSFRKQSSKKGLILIGFQKFFCVVNGHEESDFFVFWIFWLRSFFGHFLRYHGSKKWPEPKKSLKSKISFFMPVNHAKEFLKSVQNQALFSQLFAYPLNFDFGSGNFSEIFLVKNHSKLLVL